VLITTSSSNTSSESLVDSKSDPANGVMGISTMISVRVRADAVSETWRMARVRAHVT